MPRVAHVLLVAALFAAAAGAQQPPPGAPRPPPGFAPQHPPGPPPGPGGRHPPPPPPQIVYVTPPAPPSAEGAALPPPVVVPEPKPDPLPTPVQPFPQLANNEAPAPGNEPAAAGTVGADAAPLRQDLVAAPPQSASPPPLPRWLWLLAGAFLLLLAGWRAALRKSRALADEAERLARDQRQLQSAHVQLKNQSEHLRQLATNDPLTGVLTRQAFSNELRQVLEHLARFRRPLNLMLFDMDNFKQINDKQGHLVGDQALKLVAGVVREQLASEDLFGRFGGDEFLIACADQPLAETQALAESIRAAVVSSAASHVPSLAGLSLSIGIAQANDSVGYQPEPLFHRADTALYSAKKCGRNRVVLADDSLPPPPMLEAATRHLD